MTDAPGSPASAARHGRTALARQWATIALGTSHIALSRSDVEAFLLDVTDALVDILRSDPFDAAPASEAGAELIRANLTGAAALDGTVRLLGEELLPAAGIEFGQHWQQRLTTLTGALVSGYVAALRDRLFDEQEMIKKAVFRARDVAEQARQATEARWRAVFHSTAAGIAITSLDGTVQMVNPALCEILGLTEQQLLGNPLAIRLSAAYAPQVLAAFGHVAHGEHDKFVGDVSFVGDDGEPVWTRLSLSLVRDVVEKPEYAVAVVENITDLHLLRERQLDMTLKDQLTDLPNRTAFMSQLDGALQQADPDENITLCYVDLDGFKIINDGVDHTTGDRVLKRVAATLRRAFPAPATVARLGGDGFAVLLTGTQGSFDVSERVTRALDDLAEPFYEDDDTGVAVSASVGIVERPATGLTSAELVRAAEITVHRAKLNGKAQWELFDAALDEEYRSRFKLGAAIPGALETGQFKVTYQPVHRLADHTLIGLRALLRWDHPQRGLLYPADFLDMAEETGFIVPMGQWMLEQACAQIAEWEDILGPAAVRVAVNLTTRMSREQDLVQIIRHLLDTTKAPPAKLRLSMPAGVVVDDHGEPLENLETLRDIDVRTVVHGFGAGNTGLVDLRTLPVDGVTVAPGLVRAFAESEDADSPFEHALRQVADLTGRLGVSLVADGVDTLALADRLRGIGVPLGSGPAIGEPLSAGDMTALLRRTTGG
ncbi:MAG TPA: EAL domain-containing protein [Pseudonocardiaceae bacterium]|nr:EAL domain-containing protein [Pseudonocardiaceae bacterium]